MSFISLNEEKRCDFLITSTQKKIWNIELELLLELLRVCEKYNLRVILYAGSLLGTVRHKGFIPWDDDIDVALPREDYEKLVSVASKEFRFPLFFQTAQNDRKFFFGHARLRNSNTTGIISWNESPGYNNGIYIDIFILDGYIDNQLKIYLQLIKKEILIQLLSCYYADESYKCKKPKWMIELLKKVGHLKTYDYWYQKYMNNLSRYNARSKKVTIMHDRYKALSKYWCYKDDVNHIIWGDFEGYKVPIPENYDEILTNMFGDYRSFPPVEERGKWHENIIQFDPDMSYKEYLK